MRQIKRINGKKKKRKKLYSRETTEKKDNICKKNAKKRLRNKVEKSTK
jgi:hypothetical protein